jgi:hypothetical protein
MYGDAFETPEDEQMQLHAEAALYASQRNQLFNAGGVTAWETSLMDVLDGGCMACLYTWLCCPCAMADARTTMDGSDWWFNLL